MKQPGKIWNGVEHLNLTIYALRLGSQIVEHDRHWVVPRPR